MTEQRKAARATTATLHKLARSILAGPDTLFPPKTKTAPVRQALAQLGYGLGHFLGEHVVAMVDKSTEPGVFSGYLVTDRVFALRFGDERFIVPLATIQGVEREEGLFSTTVRVKTKKGDLELPTVTGSEAIEAFLGALAESGYVPSVREAPAVTVTEGDPAGIRNLVESMNGPAMPVASLVQVLWEQYDNKALQTDVALDLAVRIQTLHRALTFGRGMHDGAFISPMRPDDLAASLALLLPERASTKAEGAGFVIDVTLSEEEAVNEAAEGRSIQERIQDKIQDKLMSEVVDRVVDRITKKAVGEDLATILGEEATALRVRIEPGPATNSLATGAASSVSYWDRIRGGLPAIAKQFLGAGNRNDVGTLSTWAVYSLVGRNWKPTAEVDLPRLTALNAGLVQYEIRNLLVRLFDGWKPGPQDVLGKDEFALLDALGELVSDAQLASLGLA